MSSQLSVIDHSQLLKSKDQEIQRLHLSLQEAQSKVTSLSLSYKEQLAQLLSQSQQKTLPSSTNIIQSPSNISNQTIIDLYQQLQTLRQEKKELIEKGQQQIKVYEEKLKQKSSMIDERETEIDKLERQIKEIKKERARDKEKIMEITLSYNGLMTKHSEVEAKIREVNTKIDQSRSMNQSQIQESIMIEESYKSIELKKIVKKASMRTAEAQTTEIELANAFEHQLIQENQTLRKHINRLDVEIISWKLKSNEFEGLYQASNAHNGALLDRVKELAERVETMTRSQRNVEHLKDELFQHCKEYVEKKKVVAESNTLLETKLEKERVIREELNNEVTESKAQIIDLRIQITQLFDDLDKQNRHQQNIEAQKTSYKSKLRLANQRLKHVSHSIEDIAFDIYNKMVTVDIEKSEVDRIKTIEHDIRELTDQIKQKEDEISHELTFARKYISEFI